MLLIFIGIMIGVAIGVAITDDNKDMITFLENAQSIHRAEAQRLSVQNKSLLSDLERVSNKLLRITEIIQEPVDNATYS